MQYIRELAEYNGNGRAAVTFGKFDGLHRGHQMLVTKVRELGKVDINTAGKDELMTLSGIGEAKADAIIRYRDEHGKFQKIEDLMEVEGIKDGVFQKVKDQIKI